MEIEHNSITFTVITLKKYQSLLNQNRIRQNERGYVEARIELNVGWLPVTVEGWELPEVTPEDKLHSPTVAETVRRCLQNEFRRA